LLIIFATFSATSVMAQLSPEVAKCGELQTDGAKFQMELCSAHLGCRMVLGIQNTCAKAEKFIAKLSTAVGEGVKTLFGYRKEVTSDHVFEASLSERQRAVERDSSWREKLEPIRNVTKQVKEDIKANGDAMVSVGELNQQGFVKVNGTQFIKSPNSLFISRVVGADDNYAGTKKDTIDLIGDTREVVAYSSFDERRGNTLYANGSEYRGDSLMKNGQYIRNGRGTLIATDGRQMEGIFVNDGFSEGTIRRRDGTLAAKGKWDSAGNLAQGQIFDETGIVVTRSVDAEGDRAKAAALVAERKRQSDRESDAKRLADEEKSINQFRDSLNKLNAGQLFAKADEFSTSGDKVKAREVLRTFLSRFPDHPLATTAAQQMSSMAGQASPNNASGSTSGSRATSGASCTSALNRLQAKFNQLESNISNRTNDRVMMQQLWAQQKFRSLARSYPGCTASERDNVDSGISQNQQVCRSGGYSGDCNLGYDAYGWRATIDASIAEIMAGAGSASAETTNGNVSTQNCDSRLATQEREFEAVNRRPVPAGATPPLRRVMWMTSERIKLVKANCPNTSKYLQMIQELQTAYDQSEKACGQMMAGNVCSGPNAY
jgi:hypothetical protein